MHVPVGLTRDQAARVRRVANACPVKRALEAGFSFDERIVVGDDPGAELVSRSGAATRNAEGS